VTERVDPGIFAYQLCEHVADVEGDEHAQEYLIEMVDEIMLLEPGIREHLSDALLGELKEELVRREDAKFVHATITLIEEIERDWRSER
jgi:hypothetical protein